MKLAIAILYATTLIAAEKSAPLPTPCLPTAMTPMALAELDALRLKDLNRTIQDMRYKLRDLMTSVCAKARLQVDHCIIDLDARSMSYYEPPAESKK